MKASLLGANLACLAVAISANPARATDEASSPAMRAIGAALDDFHQAASKADEARYFSHFAPEGVFLGTDPTERWTVPEFLRFAHPYFAKGTGWTYVPRERHIVLDGDHATFDELLDSPKYGLCRGTGSLRLISGEWKIVQYSLSFPIPNAVAAKVLAVAHGP
jgi:hypothetical protein